MIPFRKFYVSFESHEVTAASQEVEICRFNDNNNTIYFQSKFYDWQYNHNNNDEISTKKENKNM